MVNLVFQDVFFSQKSENEMKTGAMPVQDRTENELLLCCARTRMDQEKIDRGHTLLREGVDWTLLGRMARLHGLTPRDRVLLETTSSLSSLSPYIRPFRLAGKYGKNLAKRLLTTPL